LRKPKIFNPEFIALSELNFTQLNKHSQVFFLDLYVSVVFVFYTLLKNNSNPDNFDLKN
jgi:hypothetical protein